MKETLPGDPSARLVRLVRAGLRSNGIKPIPRLWNLAWGWAYSLSRYYPARTVGARGKRSWPTSSEILAQYVVLLLAEIRQDSWVKLPAGAVEKAAPAVLAQLGKATGVALPPAPNPPRPIAANSSTRDLADAAVPPVDAFAIPAV